MDRNTESYLKVYKVLSEEDCIKTVNALEEKDKEFQTHQFYNSTSGTYHSYEHELSVAYNVPVILHTDHAAKKLLPWIDGLLLASEEHFEKTGKSLFSSHMIDLSEEPIEENISICKEYLKRMSKIGMTLEIELVFSLLILLTPQV